MKKELRVSAQALSFCFFGLLAASFYWVYFKTPEKAGYIGVNLNSAGEADIEAIILPLLLVFCGKALLDEIKGLA